MTNGFYDTNGIKNKEMLQQFFRDAMELSYQTFVESKYTEQNPSRRGLDKTLTIGGILESMDVTEENMSRIYCIDRYAYNRGYIDEKYGEVAYSQRFDEMLYCYMTLENLAKLVEKYNLKLKIWGDM